MTRKAMEEFKIQKIEELVRKMRSVTLINLLEN